MARSFRFEPPEPRPGFLTRPRLLRALLGRWEHRVTVVVGGPGLGKTTLLAQATAENRLAPRGRDVWIGVSPGDADGDALARDVLAAVVAPVAGAPPADAGLAGGRDEAPGPAAVAEAVWRQSPTAVCLVVDDVHWLPPGSPGAGWLAALVDALPANGHVLVAGRWAPAIPLARLSSQGTVLRLVEDELRFSGDELAGFAARRGLAVERFDGTGGWPAMAELTASVEGDLTGDYLWEEVLEPLGPDRRRVLATLSDLGGADDDLAAAALGEPVDLARALDGVPLVAQGTSGWRVPHPLWRSVRALALGPDERLAVRRRAVAHLVAGDRYDEAFTLASEAGLHDMLSDILRAATISPLRPPARRLDRWLATLPAAARDSPGAVLATGLRAAVSTPDESVEPLRTAIDQCRAAGDTDGELGAIALLGRVAWWRGDLGLLGELFPRVLELEAEGHPVGQAIAAVGRAIIADLEGDDDAVMASLDAIEPGVLDDAWQSMAGWLRATILLGRGDAADALALLGTIPEPTDPAFALTVEGARVWARHLLGQVDEVMVALPPLIDRIRAAGVMQNLVVGLTQGAYALAAGGEVAIARELLAESDRVARDTGRGGTGRRALAEAAILLADGDEAGAAAVLEKAVAADGSCAGGDRRTWRTGLAMTYVLVPTTRDFWDAEPLRGRMSHARDLAAAVVAHRDGRPLPEVDVSDPALVRAALHHRFAVELALALEATGRPEGGAILEELGPAGRDAVREVAGQRSRQARSAKSLLAAVPAPPPHTTDVCALGPLEIERDGEAVTDPDLRRERVRALLAFLVSHRTTTRAAIVAALWPDLDEKAAANNLRVTLTYLLRLLEPWRSARESAYFVRFDGQAVSLFTGDRLRIDLDQFDDHVARAARAEADGTPSLALGHHLAAVELYRGELHEGVPDADWLMLEREHFRARFVAAATRAGQLLVGRGDPDQAEPVARRVVEVDPWAEEAYGVLVAVALARGDRSAARRALDRALAALTDLGVEPSAETSRLRRLVRGT